MLTLRKSDIPEYLKQGELYRTLLENNDDSNEEVTFPADVLKLNKAVCCGFDCDQLLNSVRFWGVDYQCGAHEIITYVLTCHSRNIADVLSKYEDEFDYVYWLRSVALTGPDDKIKWAIVSGMIAVVQALLEMGMQLPSNACDLAIEANQPEMLIYLLGQGCGWDNTTAGVAIRKNRTSIIQFLNESGYPFNWADLKTSIERGHLECVIYLGRYVSGASRDAWRAAALGGHLNTLQYMHSKGYSWHAIVTAYAVQGGHLHCLKYLHEHGCPWTADVCRIAARCGHLPCLRYAHEHGCSLSSGVAAAAVEGGHTQCLAYAHEHGWTWTYTDYYSNINQVCIQYSYNGVHYEQFHCFPSDSSIWKYLRNHASNKIIDNAAAAK